MEALRNPIIFTSVAAYMLLCIAVGIWALRRTASVRDFFMAGRNLGVMVTGIAMFSSTMSGFGFVGGPGLVYAMGMSSIWLVISIGVGQTLTAYLMGKRLRLFAGLAESVSLPDAVAVRYGSDTVRLLTAVAILLGVMGYLATQILAMATVLQSILRDVGIFADISLEAAVVFATSILVFYCVTGGIVASVYTDLVQGIIMAVAGVLVFLTTLSVMDGGMAGITTSIMADDPEAMSPWGTLGIMGCLSWYFMFALGGTGQPHLLTKAMMLKRTRDNRFLPVVTIAGYLLTALLWLGIGLAMRALVVSGSHPALATPDAAAPEFLKAYAHPVLAGVVFAGLFAAIMSTADGFLNIGAAALVHDIPHAFKRSLRRELLWARIGTVVLAVVAALFALYSHYENQRLVALLGTFGWGTFGAALVPTVAIGFNWKRATPLAASVAVCSSLVVNFAIELFDVSIPHGIHGGTVSLLVSLLLFFGISFASEPPRLPKEVEAVMDL